MQYPDQHVEGTCGASIRALYAYPFGVSIFSANKMQVNLETLVHILNIFRKHTTVPSEGTLYNAFEKLSPDMKPMPWLKPLLTPFDPLQLSGRYLGDYGKPVLARCLRILLTVRQAHLVLATLSAFAVAFCPIIQSLTIWGVPRRDVSRLWT